MQKYIMSRIPPKKSIVDSSKFLRISLQKKIKNVANVLFDVVIYLIVLFRLLFFPS